MEDSLEQIQKENAEAFQAGVPLHKLMKNRDVPLFMQQPSDVKIRRLFQDAIVQDLEHSMLDEWRMNLTVVSEQHKLLIIAVEDHLQVYKFDRQLLRFSGDRP